MQPLRCKTKTKRALVARVFPRFWRFGYFYFEFLLAPKGIFSFLWLAVMIILVVIYDTASKSALIYTLIIRFPIKNQGRQSDRRLWWRV